MKKGWEIKKLHQIGKVFNGNSINESIKKIKYTGLNEGFPYIATKDIGYDSIIDYENGVNIPVSEKEQFKVVPAKTPLICAEGGSAGRKIGFTNQNVCFGNKLFAIVPIKNIDSKFLYYYYFSNSFQKHFSSEMSGIIGGVSMNKFKDIEIPLPSLSEQQRIVSTLDSVFEVIDKAKVNTLQNLKNSKELFESYLQNIFSSKGSALSLSKGEGWEEKRFDEICVLQRGFDLPTHSRNEGIHPLVSSNGITDRIDLWKVKSPGVVTGRSGTIGNVHFIEEDYWPLNTALYIKEFHGNYERFIYFFLKQFDLGKYSSGAGVPTLNRNNVHSEMVYFPKSIKEQKAIVQKLDSLSTETKKLEEIYQQKLIDLEELKKSLLEKAFKGELKTEKIEVV